MQNASNNDVVVKATFDANAFIKGILQAENALKRFSFNVNKALSRQQGFSFDVKEALAKQSGFQFDMEKAVNKVVARDLFDFRNVKVTPPKAPYRDFSEQFESMRPLKNFADFNRIEEVMGTFNKNKAIGKTAAELDRLGLSYGGMAKSGTAAYEIQQKAFKDATIQLDKMDKKLANKDTPFQGWAMSVMFLGMAMKKMFTDIWKSSSKTFNEVMHSVEGTVTGFDLMEGSMKYLGFTIGAALEPVAQWLIPIIDGFTEWASNNEGLVRALTIIGIILGGFLFTFGSLTLGYVGLHDGISRAITLLGDLKNSKFAGKIVEGFSKIVTKIDEGVIASIKWINDNPAIVKGAVAVGLISGIIAAIMWLWKLQDAMGGWDELLKSFVRGGLRLWDMFFGALKVAASDSVASMIKDLNNFIDLINELILSDFMKKGYDLLGWDTPGEIGKIYYEQYDVNEMMAEVLAKEKARTWLAPKKGYLEEGMTLEDLKNIAITVKVDAEEVASVMAVEIDNSVARG